MVQHMVYVYMHYATLKHMQSDTQAIRAYLFKLGISSEIIDIYLALQAYGPQTISELARRSGVERTRIYRLLDELKSSNLVEVQVEYKKSIFKAAPISNLQVLIGKKEQELRDLQTGYTEVQEHLQGMQHHTAATKVQHYRGSDGLRQMYWNQTRSTTENLSILYENMQVRTNLSFFERWARRCNERGIQFRGIINDNFIKTQQNWYGEHANERLESWESRYLPDAVFPITHSIVIYDDVTAYYNWKDGEIFGIELYNQQIADSQRKFFEMLWEQALPVDDLKGIDKSFVDKN